MKSRYTILVLDDDADRVTAMRTALQHELSQYEHRFFDNAPDMIAWLQSHLDTVALISLDHDLGPNRQLNGITFDPGTGRDVADYLGGCNPCCPVVIATTNSQARPGMVLVLEDAGFTCATVIPFGDTGWVRDSWLPAVKQLL